MTESEKLATESEKLAAESEKTIDKVREAGANMEQTKDKVDNGPITAYKATWKSITEI